VRTLVAIITLCLLAACSHSPSRDEAGEQALAYYQALLDGRYADFVAGLDTGDSIDTDYRTQLEANARLFMERQQQEHAGIRSVRLLSTRGDSLTAQSFLVFCFGDSANEQVVVPMVKRGNRWLMR